MTITLTREEAQQVLDCLAFSNLKEADAAAKTLRARLAQPEPEPVAWRYTIGQSMSVSLKQLNIIYGTEGGGTRIDNGEPLYTAPPQREWQGLTAYEIQELHLANQNWGNFACAIESKLKEKNS
jgi:hypothetical protein